MLSKLGETENEQINYEHWSGVTKDVMQAIATKECEGWVLVTTWVEGIAFAVVHLVFRKAKHRYVAYGGPG